MKRISQITAVLILALVLLSFIACNKKTQSAEAAPSADEITVRTVKVESKKISDPIVSSGFISSTKEARLSFKTGGVIEHIYVEEGQSVHKGQLLATLNLTEINALVEQAHQGLQKAQRDYDRAKNLYADTVATLDRKSVV